MPSPPPAPCLAEPGGQTSAWWALRGSRHHPGVQGRRPGLNTTSCLGEFAVRIWPVVSLSPHVWRGCEDVPQVKGSMQRYKAAHCHFPLPSKKCDPPHSPGRKAFRKLCPELGLNHPSGPMAGTVALVSALLR